MGFPGSANERWPLNREAPLHTVKVWGGSGKGKGRSNGGSKPNGSVYVPETTLLGQPDPAIVKTVVSTKGGEVKDLRLAKVSTMEAANAFLEKEYWPEWNQRFALPIADFPNQHRALTPGWSWLRSCATSSRASWSDLRWSTTNVGPSLPKAASEKISGEEINGAAGPARHLSIERSPCRGPYRGLDPSACHARWFHRGGGAIPDIRGCSGRSPRRIVFFGPGALADDVFRASAEGLRISGVPRLFQIEEFLGLPDG
jgi:hypothetical protein